MTDNAAYRSVIRIERVHDFHTAYCPVARTISDSVAISTSLRMESIRD